ncbi:MAG: S53 family peptidase [Firmicutes bacterium]|nr:S53 family peptidase [Bacillota bacterium]
MRIVWRRVAIAAATVAVGIGVTVGPAAATPAAAASTTALKRLVIVLPIRHPNRLADRIRAEYSPNSASYRQFLSVSAFANQFGARVSDINAIISYAESYGIQARVDPDHLLINLTGTTAQLNDAFGSHAHIAALLGVSRAASIPAAVANGIVGLQPSGQPPMQSLLATEASCARSVAVHADSGSAPVEGALSPQAYRSLYDMAPLESATAGAGQRIGILTFAPFELSDVETFWKTYGIPDSPSRIAAVPIDGFDEPMNVASAETTLDVEQASSEAPGAQVIVYEAPNTTSGLLDLFFSVVSQDTVEQWSFSWGCAESSVSQKFAMMVNEALEEGAAQGMSQFAAAGDNGAYEGYPSVKTLTSNFPSDSPWVTSAGGTTLPFSDEFYKLDAQGGFIPGSNGQPETFTLTVPHLRAWGWDYFDAYYKDLGFSSVQAAVYRFFPTGGGGGTSAFFSEPWYQAGFQSTNTRTQPDVSLDADPYTGVSLYVTVPGLHAAGLATGWNQIGGTSVVGPNLAGMSAVVNSDDQTQIGLWNPSLYTIAATSGADRPGGPFIPVTHGDNWYYHARATYNLATGLGEPRMAVLARDWSDDTPPDASPEVPLAGALPLALATLAAIVVVARRRQSS